MATLSEDSIFRRTEKHAKLALVALWTRLLTLEYREFHGVLLTRDVPHVERELLLELNELDRTRFVDYIIGDYQNRFDLLVMDHDAPETGYRSIYDRALYAWRALGTTVLCNTKLLSDTMEFDEELLLSGIAFKRWFFRSCFSHSVVTDGRPSWPGVDTSITLLKKLGAWITYYGAFSAETEKPRSIDALPGAYPNNQGFPWFGGTLKEFAKPWLLEGNLINVHALSTMSGFGRALPPASAPIAEAAAEKTFKVLTTKVTTDPYWVDLFRIATRRVVRRMQRAPVTTHCSINASACFEKTTEEGGTAAYVVENVNELLKKPFDELLNACVLIPDCGYDPFGRKVFDESISWTVNHRRVQKYLGKPLEVAPVDYRLPALGARRPLVFGFFAYRGAFLDPRVNGGRQWSLPHANPHGGFPYNREIIDLLGDINAPFYNETLGDVVTLWAFSEALQYGHFEDLNGDTVKPIIPGLAIFGQPGLKVWVQDIDIPAAFMALEEPGWKARCLTKNCAFVTVLQALLRHPLAESIGSDGRVGLGLTSSYIMWDFLKLIKGKTFNKKWYFISTDLAQATDLIPHDVLHAIWDEALPGLGINKGHPLYSLSNMIMINHQLKYKLPGGTRVSEKHECGSFMGEPVSFMGLSLYNLCVSEIAAFHCMYRLSLEVSYDLSLFENSGPLPTGYICIVGDDRFEFTDLPGLFPIVNTIYRKTNGLPSPGKNTVSSVHGILAENHVFFDGKVVKYLDTIKPKLLTPSTRFHSDNQSSILGKGSSLWQQLIWLQDTTPIKRTASVENARLVYTNMVLKGFFPKDTKAALKLPIVFPASLGGINFPIEYSSSCRIFDYEMRLLWWLVTASPLETFFEYAVGIRDITSGKRRALKSDPLSILWKENISKLIKDQGLKFSEEFDPEDNSGLYTLKSVLAHVKGRYPIPISSVTGEPQVNLTIDFVYKTFGYLPIESLIDLWERQSTFTKAFTEGVTKKEKLSFHKYVNNLNRFWANAKKNLKGVEFGPHSFKSMDDIHWKFSQRLRTFIHRDMCGGGRLSSAATLYVRLLRKSGVVHTEQGWSDISDRAVAAYVQRIRAEREESSQDD